MAENRTKAEDGPASLSLVLYGRPDEAAIRRAVQDAERHLQDMGVDYEILVAEAAGARARSQVVPEEAFFSARVRRLEVADPESYVEAARAGLAVARFARIALTDGNLDFSALRYLIPLAEQQPIIWGYRLNRRGSSFCRFLSWCRNTLARLFLGSPVRDCGGGTVISVFQRSRLAEALPETAGPLAHAEILARAHGGRRIAEVPVTCVTDPPRCPRLGVRKLLTSWRACVGFWWKFQFPGAQPEPAKGSWFQAALLAALAALILWPGNHPLLEPDEARQTEIPREMLAHDDLVLPRILGLPYYEKPPLQYWLTAGAYALFGIRPWVARLVPAGAAFVTILGLFFWARRNLGARPAFLGSLGLCLSIGFVTLGRTVVLDSLLTACVVTAWLSAHAAMSGPVFRWRWWLLAALACGLGILTKGPVALILLVPPVFVFQLLTPSVARIRWRAWAALGVIALSLTAPWYVAMGLRDPAYLVQFFWKANVLRFVKPYDHEQPWWFYLPVLFAATFPWSLLWPALAYFLMSHKRRLAALRTPALGYCLLLAGWCVTFYSLSGCKSPPYVVPALAPLSLMTGVCLEAVIFRRVARHYPYLGLARQVLPWRTTCLILVLAAVSYAVAAALDWFPWLEALGLAVLALALAFAWKRYGREVRPAFAWGACAAACLALILMPVRDLAHGYATQHSPRALARMIRHWPNSRQSPVVSFNRQWLSASFYLNREVMDVYPGQFDERILPLLDEQPEVLVFVENGEPLEDLLKNMPDTLTTEVLIPDPSDTVALVVIRHRREEPGFVRDRACPRRTVKRVSSQFLRFTVSPGA